MLAAAVTRRAKTASVHGIFGKNCGRFPLLPGDSGRSSRSKKVRTEDGSLAERSYLASSARTSVMVEWSGEVGPDESASSERSGTSGSSRLTLAASGAA